MRFAENCADMIRRDGRSARWAVSPGLTPYAAALEAMQAHATSLAVGCAPECVWLLQHPPLYTAGTSAKAADLLTPGRLPVFEAGRGGQYTYHGPGQRVIYMMLDLTARRQDIRAFVSAAQNWLIAALADFGVEGRCRDGRPGVWIGREGAEGRGEDKIAAVGVRVRRWITLHGLSLNVAPDLSHYEGIVPCGLSGHGVTSLAALGREVSMAQADAALRRHFERFFGPAHDGDPPLPPMG